MTVGNLARKRRGSVNFKQSKNLKRKQRRKEKEPRQHSKRGQRKRIFS